MIVENKEIVVKPQTNYLAELKNTQELCQLLMKTPHYAKMGPEGIFAIVETAKSLNVDPRLALGGGLYYVKGKVEMSSRMMAALIRQKKHSITRDTRSSNTVCILHGKRADTKDCWTESFSIEEAQKAGLTKNPVWANFTRDMLYARALSRLARQLFPDIIGNCYVEGEISLDSNISSETVGDEVKVNEIPQIDAPVKKSDQLTEEQHKTLSFFIDKVPQYKAKVMKFLERKGIQSLWEMPKEMYEKVLEKSKSEVQLQDEMEGGI